MRIRLLILGLSSILTGCAVTADGIGFARKPPDFDKIPQAKEQLQTNASAAAVKAPIVDSPDAEAPQPGIVVVGTTGPFRNLSEEELKKTYTVYLKAADKWHPGEAAKIDETTFRSTFAGYASIETYSIPGFLNWRSMALVPKTVADQATFASKAGSMLFGTTGDLVSARSNEGIMLFERVLCRDDATYHDCARTYERGYFDGITGQELAEGLKPKKGGKRIDPKTYRKIATPQ